MSKPSDIFTGCLLNVRLFTLDDKPTSARIEGQRSFVTSSNASCSETLGAGIEAKMAVFKARFSLHVVLSLLVACVRGGGLTWIFPPDTT